MRRAALVVWLASIAAWLSYTLLVVSEGAVVSDIALEIAELLAFVVLGTFGYLIARRQPNNAIAWLALIPGLVFPLEALITQVAEFGLAHYGPDHPMTLVAGWLALWVWIPGPLLGAVPAGAVPGRAAGLA